MTRITIALTIHPVLFLVLSNVIRLTYGIYASVTHLFPDFNLLLRTLQILMRIKILLVTFVCVQNNHVYLFLQEHHIHLIVLS